MLNYAYHPSPRCSPKPVPCGPSRVVPLALARFSACYPVEQVLDSRRLGQRQVFSPFSGGYFDLELDGQRLRPAPARKLSRFEPDNVAVVKPCQHIV